MRKQSADDYATLQQSQERPEARLRQKYLSMTEQPNPGSATPPPPSKGRLLIVDDDLSFRDGFARLLAKQHFECLLATDAESALGILERELVDALISDLHMPGDSGIGLVRRAAKLRPGLPAFLLTGQPTWETAAQSIGLRVAGYIEKPPVVADLVVQLEQSIAAYHRLQLVQSSRQQLQAWEQQLAVLEEELVQNKRETSTGDYLRITLRNIASQLAEFASAACLRADLDSTGQDMQSAALVAALRKTIGVLEETRKSFKSKELGELRKQLTSLLQATHSGEVPPQASSAETRPS